MKPHPFVRYSEAVPFHCGHPGESPAGTRSNVCGCAPEHPIHSVTNLTQNAAKTG